MKHYYLLFCSCILLCNTNAQPVLNQSNGFNDGDIIEIYVDSEPVLDEGSGGTSQTWDFSSLYSADPAMEFEGVSASVTPFTADFPLAPIASTGVDYSGNVIYNYFTNDSVYTTWGYESNEVKLTYTNPRDILRYPFSYGDEFTDSYYGLMPQGYNSGIVTEKADGYGDLILPTGLFHNCLRVREIRTDTLGGTIMTVSNDTSYKFYVVNDPEPLCQVNHHHSSDGLSFNEIYWQNIQPSGIADMANLQIISVFPNPCSDVLNFNLSTEINSEGVQIHNACGKYFDVPFHRSGNTLQMDISDLPQGIYFLSAKSEMKKYEAKFIRSTN
jgi:hypothetical protein